MEALQRIVVLQQQLLELQGQGASPALAAVTEAPRARHVRKEMPWLTTIRAWLEQHPALQEVTSTRLLAECLGIHGPTNVQRGAVGRVMRALGWKRGRRRHPGGLHWVYTRPASS